MAIEPTTIVRGIGAADRKALASLLALYESSALPTILWGATKDAASWTRARLPDDISWLPTASDHHALEEEIREKSDGISSSTASTDELRLRLWMHLRHGLSLSPELPLASSGVPAAFEDLGVAVCRSHLAILDNEKLRELEFADRLAEQGRRLSKLVIWWDKDGGSEAPPFATVVEQQVTRLLAAAAREGKLDEELKDQLLVRVREVVKGLSDDDRRALLEQLGVDELSEDASWQVLLGGGGVIGFAVLVDVAGFSAYILAAKLSAIIPLVGGKTLVSLLAVFASPEFVMISLAVGGAFIGEKVKRDLGLVYAAPVAALLSVAGLDATEAATDSATAAFRRLPEFLTKAERERYREVSTPAPEFPSDLEVDPASAGRVAAWTASQALKVGKAVFTRAKTAFVAERYPDLIGYLDYWERSTGERVG